LIGLGTTSMTHLPKPSISEGKDATKPAASSDRPRAKPAEAAPDRASLERVVLTGCEARKRLANTD
jgi:hypothetical protein